MLKWTQSWFTASPQERAAQVTGRVLGAAPKRHATKHVHTKACGNTRKCQR